MQYSDACYHLTHNFAQLELCTFHMHGTTATNTDCEHTRKAKTWHIHTYFCMDMHFTLNVSLQINPWLTSIGFSLCFGTIMAKMGRVFYIFHNPTLRKKYVRTLNPNSSPHTLK